MLRFGPGSGNRIEAEAGYVGAADDVEEVSVVGAADNVNPAAAVRVVAAAAYYVVAADSVQAAGHQRVLDHVNGHARGQGGAVGLGGGRGEIWGKDGNEGGRAVEVFE